MATESITKYRPYLSLAELDAILYCIQFVQENNDPNGHTDTESARVSILKTKTMAELNIQAPAYKTNPRQTLIDKLGFGVNGVDDLIPLVKETLDFNAMMENLIGTLAVSPDQETNTEQKK